MGGDETIESLPDGWSRRTVQRKNGSTAGGYDVYLTSPLGKRLRSRVELVNYIKENLDITIDPYFVNMDRPASITGIQPGQCTHSTFKLIEELNDIRTPMGHSPFPLPPKESVIRSVTRRGGAPTAPSTLSTRRRRIPGSRIKTDSNPSAAKKLKLDADLVKPFVFTEKAKAYLERQYAKVSNWPSQSQISYLARQLKCGDRDVQNVFVRKRRAELNEEKSSVTIVESVSIVETMKSAFLEQTDPKKRNSNIHTFKNQDTPSSSPPSKDSVLSESPKMYSDDDNLSSGKPLKRLALTEYCDVENVPENEEDNFTIEQENADDDLTPSSSFEMKVLTYENDDVIETEFEVVCSNDDDKEEDESFVDVDALQENNNSFSVNEPPSFVFKGIEDH